MIVSVEGEEEEVAKILTGNLRIVMKRIRILNRRRRIGKTRILVSPEEEEG